VLAFVLVDVVDGTDIGMIEGRSGLGFALKSLSSLQFFRLSDLTVIEYKDI